MTLATRLVGVNRFTTIRQATVFQAPHPKRRRLRIVVKLILVELRRATLLERLVEQKE